MPDRRRPLRDRIDPQGRPVLRPVEGDDDEVVGVEREVGGPCRTEGEAGAIGVDAEPERTASRRRQHAGSRPEARGAVLEVGEVETVRRWIDRVAGRHEQSERRVDRRRGRQLCEPSVDVLARAGALGQDGVVAERHDGALATRAVREPTVACERAGIDEVITQSCCAEAAEDKARAAVRNEVAKWRMRGPSGERRRIKQPLADVANCADHRRCGAQYRGRSPAPVRHRRERYQPVRLSRR